MITLSEKRETSDDHDRIEEDVLVLDEKLRGRIEFENDVVESRVDVGEEFRRESECGEELNVGVVFGMIRDDFERRGKSATKS